MAEDAEDDALAAVAVAEAGHGARTAAHFTEGALDDVGGAHFLPVGRRDVKKVQQVFQIALDARDGAGAAMLPAMFPLAIGAQRFAIAAGAIEGGGFGGTAAFLAADFAGDVAHFVRPTELPRDARIPSTKAFTTWARFSIGRRLIMRGLYA